ncbi:MAG: PEP-CTERM sorting domain-containing protein [Tepidisphaeraceae bacterium]
MYSIRRFAVVSALAAVSLLPIRMAQGVILSRTSTRNTAAPTGTNANSGWQYQGHWAGGFLGTAIHKNYFITAEHLGGGVGAAIYYQGKNYTTTAAWGDPSSDLKIYKISGAFPSWAPIYTGSSEVGKKAIVIGRGTPRGSEVKKGTTLKGWKWGAHDKVRNWGENNIATSLSDPTYGPLLKFTFNRQGTSGALYNEATLSTGDSGGGLFINDAGKWKLAGINYLVDNPFSLTGSDAGFSASIFDKGGLYTRSGGSWNYNTDTSTDITGNWYATRISTRQSWIKSIVGTISTGALPSGSASSLAVTSVPEPASAALVVISASALLMRRRRK